MFHRLLALSLTHETLPSCGNPAASTTLPQPPGTNQNVPINFAITFDIVENSPALRGTQNLPLRSTR